MVRSLAFKRIQKRVDRHIERQRERFGEGFTLACVGKVPLLSIGERIWLTLLGGLLLWGLYWLRGEWLAYLTLLPLGAFFLWKGAFGAPLDLSAPVDADAPEADPVSDDVLQKRVREILLTREASFVTVHFLLFITVAALEVMAILLGAIAAVLGG